MTGERRWSYETPAEGYAGIASLPGEAVVVTGENTGVTGLDVGEGVTGTRRSEVRPARGLSGASALDELLIVAGHDRMRGDDVSTRESTTPLSASADGRCRPSY